MFDVHAYRNPCHSSLMDFSLPALAIFDVEIQNAGIGNIEM